MRKTVSFFQVDGTKPFIARVEEAIRLAQRTKVGRHLFSILRPLAGARAIEIWEMSAQAFDARRTHDGYTRGEVRGVRCDPKVSALCQVAHFGQNVRATRFSVHPTMVLASLERMRGVDPQVSSNQVAGTFFHECVHCLQYLQGRYRDQIDVDDGDAIHRFGDSLEAEATGWTNLLNGELWNLPPVDYFGRTL